MKNEIQVLVNGKNVIAEKGVTLSDVIKGEKPCGGHGKCRKCKVRVKGSLSEPTPEELRFLSQHELSCGVRLACLTQALGDCEIQTLSAVKDPQIKTNGVLPERQLNPLFSTYGVAVDIGTTTLVAQLYNTEGGMIAESSRLNPQSEWGADVISRIEAALNGKAAQLSKAIRTALNEMISAFSAVIDTNKIDAVVITGNTVMLSLLTEQSLEPFSHAPFNVKRLFGETLAADTLSLFSLRPDTQVYLPPCISAFVGADITCAILATELCKKTTAMLADIGTNGEMALWHNGKLTVCSTAAGPAFEGVGISMGMQGITGAIDKVMLKDGKLVAHVIGNKEPIGICGSGLIDAVACLIEAGMVDETGYLKNDMAPIASNVALVQEDIRAFQLAKSAICAGLLTLIEEQKLRPSDLSSLYIAGGFGNYLDTENAIKIGLLPRELAALTCTVGNAAISGAAMLLLDSTIKTVAHTMIQEVHVLDLAMNSAFSEHYMLGMLLEEQS